MEIMTSTIASSAESTIATSPLQVLMSKSQCPDNVSAQEYCDESHTKVGVGWMQEGSTYILRV